MGGGGDVLGDCSADAAEEGEVWAGGGGEVGLLPRLDGGGLRELVLVFPRGVALGHASAGGGGGAEALACCGERGGVVEAGVVGALPVAGAAAGGVEGVGEEGGFEGGGAEHVAGVVEVGGGARGGVGEHVAC